VNSNKNGDTLLRQEGACLWRMAWGRELGICLLLILLTLAVRMGTAKPALRGDAAFKWQMCRESRSGGTGDAWQWNHHTARWALMIPVVGLQSLLGDSPKYYYIFPVFIWCVGILATYSVGRQLRSRMTGCVCALAVLLFPEACFYGTQFLPDIPEAAWLLVALAFLVRWKQRRGWAVLVFSAVAFFLGYGSKATILYFLPGIAIWLYLDSKRWKPCFLYLSILLGLFLVETVILYVLSGEPLGRIGILAHASRGLRNGENPLVAGMTFGQWASSWKDYFEYRITMQFAIFVPLVLSLVVLVLRIKKLYLLAVAIISGFLCHTWAIVSVSPFYFPQGRICRYQTQLTLLGTVLIALFFAQTPMRFKIRVPKRNGRFFARLISLLPRRVVHMTTKPGRYTGITGPLLVCHVNCIVVLLVLFSCVGIDCILLRNFLPTQGYSCWQFWRDADFMVPRLHKESSFAIMLSKEDREEKNVSLNQLAYRVMAMFAPLSVSREIDVHVPTVSMRDDKGNYIRIYGNWDGHNALPMAEHRTGCYMWQPSG
jgi:hypothetical protein